MSETITRGVCISVSSQYLPEQSSPEHGEYIFGYRICIQNQGEQTVQLLSRHWIITDANGSIKEVRGTGVVGEQPTLKSGEAFEYTSGCPLSTPVGTMHGHYTMVVLESGEQFEAQIKPFLLAVPKVLN
ncbi:Co2+/Mg2+ efflux protein ApaG [Sinimarinibacterium sp. NLF-5-8]|uniref:Co2+/Mg2+ efflux protein ApaG n=1 Tax=Sinimarinibacterium sp. NLF-5-8 TaxID=2698684 RepID=UPI00137C2845|nr:Co2+/Mg2+ efflux protein ApaG [Sinimarinibacterium sp. NLF-5-8]QHS10700.1 Co2+/Mg2+ efflux protein ApaG [Sinimarinibacterium sp. NLF-5-8]